MSESLSEFIQQINGTLTPTVIELVNARKWLETAPPEADQILENMVDAGDKLVIIAPSKMRKTFFATQMAVALTAHSKFLGWNIHKKRKVLYVQFEVRDHHCWRRIRSQAKALGVSAADIEDRLMILPARGLGLVGADGLERIKEAMREFGPEVVILDPLYKLAAGVENAAEDFKILLNAFDQMAEETGAAIFYVHHDTKGSAGDKNIRDRGAGSNVLGRDYDACITLTPHVSVPDAAVVEVLLRNYPPQNPFTIVWDCMDGGYCFRLADDLTPDKRTSKTKTPAPLLDSYLPAAKEILFAGSEMKISLFKARFREKTGLSRDRINDFTTWAIESRNPPLEVSRWERGRGLNDKFIRFKVEG